MSNKASSHLFDLIKSLTKSEKRYFKLFASRHTIGEENAYIRLFDFVDRMDDYQEDLIFMHFKGQAFLNKFSITKSRLYDNILRSLDSFHSASSVDAQIYRSIHSAEILFNKGLYTHTEKVLRSAEKQAVKHECHNLLLEIKQKQKQIIESGLYSKVNKNTIEELYSDESEIIRRISNYSTLWKVKSLLFQEINMKGKLRNDEDINAIKKLVEEADSIDLSKASVNNVYLFHHIKSAYYFAVNELGECYEHLKRNYALLLKEKNFVSNQPNLFFSLLTNTIYVSTRLKDFSRAQEYLAKLKLLAKDVDNHTQNIAVKYFSSTYSLELSLYIEKGEYEKGLDLIPQIEEAYRLYGDNIPTLRKAYLDFQMAVLYLSVSEFNEALSKLNLILNNPEISPKQEIFSISQMLNLIVHVELENDRFLPYAHTSAKRYFKKQKTNANFEKLFLKIINEMMKIQNTFDLQERLHVYLDEMKSLLGDKHEQTVFEYFDFYAWVKSKIIRKTYREVRQLSISAEA